MFPIMHLKMQKWKSINISFTKLKKSLEFKLLLVKIIQPFGMLAIGPYPMGIKHCHIKFIQNQYKPHIEHSKKSQLKSVKPIRDLLIQAQK